VLDGELLDAERTKLSACPSTTTVVYTGNPAAPSFGDVKRAGARQPRPGEVELRLANAEDADLFGATLGAGVLRLEIRLLAPVGQEVTSGTYPAEAPQPPEITSLRMSGTTPPAAEGEEEGRFGDASDWAGGESKVEVIARTRDRMCGRFHLEDARHEAKGDFDVPLTMSAGRPD